MSSVILSGVIMSMVIMSSVILSGDNEHGDNEQCDIEWCDSEQGDGDHIYEQKVQIRVEMGFAEDDVRGALNETGWNEFLALLMLCAQNTNTK